jgi:hypothetical protein
VRIQPLSPSGPHEVDYCLFVSTMSVLADIINYVKFGVGIVKGFRLIGGVILAPLQGEASHPYHCVSATELHLTVDANLTDCEEISALLH